MNTHGPSQYNGSRYLYELRQYRAREAAKLRHPAYISKQLNQHNSSHLRLVVSN